MKRLAAGWLVILLVGIGCPASVLGQTGQFFDEFGASCKSIGMGQAFTAVADDFSASYYNPAGLTQVSSVLASTIGYYYAKPMARAKIAWGPDRYDFDLPTSIDGERSSHGAIIGVASSLDIPSVVEAFPWFRRLAFGLAFWVNLPLMLTYDIGPESFRPHFFRYDEGFALLAMTYSLAIEVTPWCSVGVGGFLSQKTYAKQEVFSAQNYSNVLPPPLANPDEVIGSRLSIWSRAEAFVIPLAGILLRPPMRAWRDKLAFGVSWRRGQKVHHARGPLIVSIGFENPDVPGDPLFGIPFITTPLGGIVGFQPTQVTFGLSAVPVSGLTIAADVTWKDYSKYVDYLDQRPDPPFVDTWVPRIGLEYAFNPGLCHRWLQWMEAFRFRFGYYFEPTPVPSIDKAHNIFDTDQDVFSTGIGFDFRSRGGRLLHSVEAYYQHHHLRTRYVSNAEDNYFGPATLYGHVWSAGVTMTTAF